MSTQHVKRYFTKATDQELGAPRHSANWLVSRRGWLRVFEDRLECGDWVIPAASVTKATLYSVGMGHVLAVSTQERTYQFGLNPWVKVPLVLPFPFTTEKAKLGYSPFSIAVRVAAVAYIIYVLLR